VASKDFHALCVRKGDRLQFMICYITRRTFSRLYSQYTCADEIRIHWPVG